MANIIETIDIYQKVLDEQMTRELTSIRMERNASMIKYTGGKTVRIPKIEMDGLGDYSATSGFPEGDITLEYESHDLQYDRGKGFSIDAREVDESGLMATAGNVMGQFQRTKVVPEIDAARYSRIWEKANADGRTSFYTPDSTTILKEISDAVEDLQDVIGETEPLTIYIGKDANKALKDSKDIEKKLDVTTFNRGDVSLKVKTLDDIPLVKVPSARFKTEYTFGSNGFTPVALAMDINFMVVADRALLAINKLEKTRTFAPDVNQNADAWKMQYRRHHDLLIPDNKLEGVFISFTPVAAPAMTATVAAAAVTVGATKFTATVVTTGNTLGYVLGAASLGDIYNAAATDIGAVNPYTSGADILATAGQYLTMVELDTVGHVVLSKEVVLASGDIKA